MNLPKWLSDKISDYEYERWCDHVENCAYYDVDPHDIDPLENFRDRLALCLPDDHNGDRYVAWNELTGTYWSPIRKALKLCKVGWHSYSMGKMKPEGGASYRCSDCLKWTERVPRWAR